jgi:hypothetical protein
MLCYVVGSSVTLFILLSPILGSLLWDVSNITGWQKMFGCTYPVERPPLILLCGLLLYKHALIIMHNMLSLLTQLLHVLFGHGMLKLFLFVGFGMLDSFASDFIHRSDCKICTENTRSTTFGLYLPQCASLDLYYKGPFDLQKAEYLVTLKQFYLSSRFCNF